MSHSLECPEKNNSGHGLDRGESFACPICDWGLAVCSVCGGAEASLPKDCPGRKMTYEEENAVVSGTLDFNNGRWVPKGEL